MLLAKGCMVREVQIKMLTDALQEERSSDLAQFHAAWHQLVQEAEWWKLIPESWEHNDPVGAWTTTNTAEVLAILEECTNTFALAEDARTWYQARTQAVLNELDRLSGTIQQ